MTAVPAQALPSRCDQLLDRISFDWDQASEYAAWASIDRHDGNWQDYSENMEPISVVRSVSERE